MKMCQLSKYLYISELKMLKVSTGVTDQFQLYALEHGILFRIFLDSVTVESIPMSSERIGTVSYFTLLAVILGTVANELE